MKVYTKLVFISREKLTQFVYTKIIPDESAASIREALLAACIELIPQAGGCIRVDPGSSLQSLAKEAGLDNKEDNIFRRFNITIDLGRTHNVNKNPIAENLVKETHKEISRAGFLNEQIDNVQLMLVIKNINSRVKS